MAATASLRASAPRSARRAVRAWASSSGPMGVSFCRITSPASSSFAIYMMETPVVSSPFRMAQLMGAAPRYLGSRDEWTLIEPYLGASRMSSGRMRP